MCFPAVYGYEPVVQYARPNKEVSVDAGNEWEDLLNILEYDLPLDSIEAGLDLDLDLSGLGYEETDINLCHRLEETNRSFSNGLQYVETNYNITTTPQLHPEHTEPFIEMVVEATSKCKERDIQFCSVCLGVRRHGPNFVSNHTSNGFCPVKNRSATMDDKRELRRIRQKIRRKTSKKNRAMTVTRFPCALPK
mmetsp:Transcript_28320/g.45692  ORF Transcript_28320/g.45692 Transcript_28320/m.45692 type:complete len:193 (-) Transcript_28320:1008-1586(-)